MDESLFIEACFSSSSFFQISEILAFLDYQIDCTNFYKVGITTAIYRSSSTVKDAIQAHVSLIDAFVTYTNKYHCQVFEAFVLINRQILHYFDFHCIRS